MAGGLLQLVIYGSQDLFLTGNPEITFFKIVYRRHTNFAIESIRVPFDDTVGFGTTSHVIIPKVGDLVYKTYAEITLPSFNYHRTVNSETINTLRGALTAATLNYEYVKTFLYYNLLAYREVYNYYISDNVVYSSEIYNKINEVFTPFHSGSPPADTDFENLIESDYTNEKLYVMTNGGILFRYTNITETSPVGSMVNYGNISLESVNNYWSTNDPTIIPKQDTMNIIIFLLNNCSKLNKKYFDRYLTARKALEDAYDANYKFAWVERIGHSIIDYVDVKIGGDKIDKHYGIWLDIWYELTGNRDQENAYFKMIGNVPELTTFDRTIKPEYVLMVPLQFWFSRFNGVALPIIALEYHDVSVEMKFRKFSECAYVEADSLGTAVNLDDIIQDLGKDINVNLLIDYVYLDSYERKKFAQSSHEYLIEQLQVDFEENKLDPQLQLDLNFEHPCKELIWVAQKSLYTQNLDGHTKCQWTNYSTNDNKIGNPVIYSQLDFNNYNRIAKYGYQYFNYVQPYIAHRNTPCDGVNSYSFALSPEELQPSGTCNMSRIPRIRLYLTLNPTLYEQDISMDVKVFTINYNVLRMMSGLGGVAYT